MEIKLNQVLVFVIALLISISSFSQTFKTEKRIYLLDITGSMYGKGSGENIFTEVKNNLIQTINSLDNPQTNITVITFGKGVVDIWEAQATANGKSNLITNINTHNEYKGLDLQTATNICDALSAANDKISINMLNYLFLFTDGFLFVILYQHISQHITHLNIGRKLKTGIITICLIQNGPILIGW